jgi:hypothetical protein
MSLAAGIGQHAMHAAEMHDLIPHAQLAVLPGTRHTEVVHRTEVIVPLLARFLERG